MADTPIKLAQQLVMTPQLQMAVRLLATPTTELGALLDTMTGLEPADAGDPDLLVPSDDERATAEEDGVSVWSFATERPPGFADEVDVWIAGEPPVARAGRAALPHVRVRADASADERRDATWFARALRQRAKTYERVVGALLAARPQLAGVRRADELAPVTTRAIAEAIGIHESTVTRVAAACRFQTAVAIWRLAAGKRGIGLTAG